MKSQLVDKAIKLRKEGFSIREISEKIGISKSTASLWLRNIKLSKKAEKRIQKLGVAGRNNAINSVRKRIEKENEEILIRVKDDILRCSLLKNDLKIICALLYWCEGGKTEKAKLSFINSDPKLVRYFINTFREAFDIDERRFRALIYLHEYHNKDKQTQFWSKITGIPIKQFSKPYLKKNSGKRERIDYQGCISVRYYGREITKEMLFLIKEISK